MPVIWLKPFHHSSGLSVSPLTSPEPQAVSVNAMLMMMENQFYLQQFVCAKKQFFIRILRIADKNILDSKSY